MFLFILIHLVVMVNGYDQAGEALAVETGRN